MSCFVFTCTQYSDLPVHRAADNGHLDVVKYLVDLQPDTVSVKDKVSRAVSVTVLVLIAHSKSVHIWQMTDYMVHSLYHAGHFSIA